MSYLLIKPILIKDRVSMIFVRYSATDVNDGAYVVVGGVNAARLFIPWGQYLHRAGTGH